MATRGNRSSPTPPLCSAVASTTATTTGTILDVTTDISRRAVLGLAAGAAATAALGSVAAAAPATAAPPPRGPGGGGGTDLSRTLLTEWERSPGTHHLLADFTRAGYRQGARVPSPRVVVNVRQFGAKGDGTTDDVAAFNAAVRSAGEQGGGTVLVPPGTYHLSGPVWMHWSNVVLRGANRRNTVLYFSRPLKEGYRSNWQVQQKQERWSWAGGQIWVIPEPVLRKLEQEEWLGTEGFVPGPQLASVAPAPRGTRDLTVSTTARLRAGDMVLLETDNPGAPLLTHLAGDTEGARAYDWTAGAPQLVRGTAGFYPQYGTLQWPVRIERVLDATTVRLVQPVKHDLREEWPSTLRTLGPAVTEVGVERLTIRNELLPQTPHNQNPGSNGVHFQAAHDCWASDVQVENCDVGFGFTGAKSITVSGAVITGRATHHPFVMRMQSHDNLVQGFTVGPFTTELRDDARLHGLNVEGLSSGNVYRDGFLYGGTFDSHRALPFENARTNIRLINTGTMGGSARSGPYFGARFAHWGIDVLNDRPYAVTVGDVAPRSVTVGISGVAADATSGLKADYPGGVEALANVTDVTATAVRDLYEAQRRLTR